LQAFQASDALEAVAGRTEQTVANSMIAALETQRSAKMRGGYIARISHSFSSLELKHCEKYR
jgi:hypothetical protein